jgi:peptide/nickel transport system permease protein
MTTDSLAAPRGDRARAPVKASWTKQLFGDRAFRVGVLMLGLVILLAVLAPLIAPYHPLERLRDEDGNLLRLSEPSAEHWFGTTNYGRDIASQVIWGTRRSLEIGVVAALVSVLIGVNAGLIGGYFGGWFDQLLLRINDATLSLPFLPLAIVMIGTLGRSDTVLIIAIAMIFWRVPARVIRSHVLVLKEMGYVRAARIAGASPLRIIYRQLAPNVLPFGLLYGMLLTSEAVIAEATLSFLGFASADSMSLGTVMFDAFASQEIRDAWWWPLFPGLVIMLFVMSIALIAEAYERHIIPSLERT